MGIEFATTIIRTRSVVWSVKIDVRFEVEKVRQHFKGFRQDQIPFATATTINECLKEAAPLVQREMQRVFDRPTAWTLNSYRVLKWSNKRDLVGIVGFKDAAGVTIKPGRKEGRFPGYPSDYLQPHMEGSPRNSKGLEIILREVGIIGPGEFLVPSKFQRLDQYGNVPRGIVQ